MSKILVTGAAGFIGLHLVLRLIHEKHTVFGLDNINDYYDVNLKNSRLIECGIEIEQIEYNTCIHSQKFKNYTFIKLNLEDGLNIEQLFSTEKFDIVCNLAAQPGVRYSLDNPLIYIQSNIVGFTHILEGCRYNKVKHLIYASSSSVYGLNEKIPFSTTDNVDHPASLYAASKKSNELLAHTYSHLFGLPTTGLRFFTVYGPWGRPDMALFLFTEAILNKKPISIFNNGELERDFTYVQDIVDGIISLISNPPIGDKLWNGVMPKPNASKAPYKIYNIGNNSPTKLLDFIEIIEKILETKAIKEFLPMQPGDVIKTWADCKDLENDFGYFPKTNIEFGVSEFIAWYKSYYKV